MITSAPLQPIDMVLFCPACGKQHIDAPADCPDSPGICECRAPHWTNPPHRSHLCHGCGHIWRPADVPTNGVKAIRSRGVNDSPVINEDTVRVLARNPDADEGTLGFAQLGKPPEVTFPMLRAGLKVSTRMVDPLSWLELETIYLAMHAARGNR